MAEKNHVVWYRYLDYLCLLMFAIEVAILFEFYHSGEIEIIGVYTGLPVGTILGIVMLVGWSRLAKRKCFSIMEASSQHQGKLMIFFLSVSIIGFLSGIGIGVLGRRYSQINIEHFLGTLFLVGTAVFFAVCFLGLYRIQKKYRGKFYL